MTPHGLLAATCPGRFRPMLLRACVATLLIWLVIYAVTDVTFDSTSETWNLTKLLQSAAEKFNLVIKQSSMQRETKLVLLWTDYFSKRDWLPSTLEMQCPVPDCAATSDRSLLPNSSAVILHLRNVNVSDLPHCDPSFNAQCPPWVLFNKEAPPHTSRDILKVIDGMVHLVASYRRDSDIFAPYGKILPRRSKNYSKPEYNPNKRLVCWLVSNCNAPSNREEFVSSLEDHIDVDTYGQCGHMKCPFPHARDCYRWLSERCLFYLSLENSICKDYTTEKLYYALSTDMVPVVLGNSSNYLHLPQGSYINAADFSSPKELAEYLVMVGKNRKLYLSYLRWKRAYEVKDYSYKWFCDLCARLHGTKVGNFTPRENLVSWWFEQSNCVSWRLY